MIFMETGTTPFDLKAICNIYIFTVPKLTEAAFIHPHDSKGNASCVPPENFRINYNEYELITPQPRNSSRKIILYQEKDELGVKR